MPEGKRNNDFISKRKHQAVMNADRKKKIELLRSIMKGERNLKSLVDTIKVEVWDDEGQEPGFYKDDVSGRVVSVDQLRSELTEDLKRGVTIIWCDAELKEKIIK